MPKFKQQDENAKSLFLLFYFPVMFLSIVLSPLSYKTIFAIPNYLWAIKIWCLQPNLIKNSFVFFFLYFIQWYWVWFSSHLRVLHAKLYYTSFLKYSCWKEKSDSGGLKAFKIYKWLIPHYYHLLKDNKTFNFEYTGLKYRSIYEKTKRKFSNHLKGSNLLHASY